jgi:hypothetical protein
MLCTKESNVLVECSRIFQNTEGIEVKNEVKRRGYEKERLWKVG